MFDGAIDGKSDGCVDGELEAVGLKDGAIVNDGSIARLVISVTWSTVKSPTMLSIVKLNLRKHVSLGSKVPVPKIIPFSNPGKRTGTKSNDIAEQSTVVGSLRLRFKLTVLLKFAQRGTSFVASTQSLMFPLVGSRTYNPVK